MLFTCDEISSIFIERLLKLDDYYILHFYLYQARFKQAFLGLNTVLLCFIFRFYNWVLHE